ncbi:MAG: restriction endonuclease subunit S, partial [Acidimicrobiia bacterium]
PLRAGDVLLTSEAPLGEVAYLPVDLEACTGQRLFALRGKAGRLHGRFLYYLLRSDSVQSQLHGRATGTTVSGIRQAELVKVRFELPAIDEQLAIADVLGALDDKIESNRRLVATSESILESMATLLDGDRIRLGELVEVSRETVNPAALGDLELELFSIPAFDSGRRPERAAASAVKSGKTRVDRESILLSRLNPRFPRVWYAVPAEDVTAVCSTEFMVLRPRHGQTPADVWLACTQPELRDAMTQRATGTSGSHQRVRPDDVLAIFVTDPRVLDDDARNEALELLQLVDVARRESEALSALRDALLPELISGRLRAEPIARLAEVTS